MFHATPSSLPVCLCLAVAVGCGGSKKKPAAAPQPVQPPDRIWVQPYLQNPTTTSMTVLWWTTSAQSDGAVEYGLGGLDGSAAASNLYIAGMGKWLHEATITGLEEATEYRYRVRSGTLQSATYSFKTAKGRRSNLSFSFLGDGRTDNDDVIKRHRQLVDMAGDSDLIFEIGDAVKDGSATHWDRFLRRVLTASDPADPGSVVGSHVPYHLVVGNHEISIYPPMDSYPGDWVFYVAENPMSSIARYKAVVAPPPNGSPTQSWQERYYALDYGAVTFIVLDANNTSDDALDNHDPLFDGTTPDWQPGSEQYEWMVKELARAAENSVFTFVLFHPSPYSKGVHGTPCPDRDHNDPRQPPRQVPQPYCNLDPNRKDVCIPEGDGQRGYELRTLQPVFARYGVDAVLTSHEHFAEHSLAGPPGFEASMDVADPRNINYLVMGNSGNSSRDAAPCWEYWMSINGDGKPPYYSKWFYTWAGKDELASFLRVDIENQDDKTWEATFYFQRNDGEKFNQFSIRRDDPRANGDQ